MKKVFLTLWSILGFASLQAQFHAGATVGLPLGDTSDSYSFSLSFDGRYLQDVGENFELGGTVGLLYGNGKDIDIDGVGTVSVNDLTFLPIAATGRYEIDERFEIGLDLGYALGLSSGNDGGLYFAPHATYELTDNWELIGGFRSVSKDGPNFNSLSIGIEYEFGD